MKFATKLIKAARLAPVLMITLFVMGGTSSAQDTEYLPEPLKNLIAEGAQMRYLGNQHGLDGWISIKGGQEQYFYVTPDGQAFLMGLLFDKSGRLETVKQVKRLQAESGEDTLDLFAEESLNRPDRKALGDQGQSTTREFKTPAEQLYSDIESSNWVALGRAGAPYIYTFIDPQCPFCHAFINDMRGNYLDNGLVQIRMIPVGFKDETRAQAALLLAVPNAQKRWFDHLDGDAQALPINPDINQQGVERNLSIIGLKTLGAFLRRKKPITSVNYSLWMPLAP